MAVSGNVFYMDDTNTEDFVSLCTQLQGLLHTANNDFEDMCASSLIKPFAKYKLVTDTTLVNLLAAKPYGYRGENDDCNISIPIITQSDFEAGASSVLSKIQNAAEPTYINVPAGYPKRMRDFDGYDHGADVNGVFGWPSGTLYIQTPLSLSLYVASFYTNTGSKDASVLSLVDLMQRFDNKINWTDINNDTSYGYLGVLLFYYNTVDSTMSMALRSHSLLTTASDQRTITLDLSALNSDDSGLGAIKKGTTCYLVPCICNYNTDSKWVGVGSGSSVNYLECAILPFSGYTNKSYSVRAGSAAYPDEQLLKCGTPYNGTLRNDGTDGNPIKVYVATSTGTSSSIFVGLTLSFTTALTSSKTLYYRIWDRANNDTAPYASGTITIAAGGSASLQVYPSKFYNSTSKIISGEIQFSENSSFSSFVGYVIIGNSL